MTNTSDNIRQMGQNSNTIKHLNIDMPSNMSVDSNLAIV